MRSTQLTDYLQTACLGRTNIQKSAELERALHLSGTDLRKLVHRLRRQGVPITSSRDGYFYAATAEEVYANSRGWSGGWRQPSGDWKRRWTNLNDQTDERRILP